MLPAPTLLSSRSALEVTYSRPSVVGLVMGYQAALVPSEGVWEIAWAQDQVAVGRSALP